MGAVDREGGGKGWAHRPFDGPEKKFPAGPGEATENHFTFASGGSGYPPDPH